MTPWQPALVHAFVPSWVQAAGLLAVLAIGLVMLVLGRAATGKETLPEVALIAGWGLVSLVLTLWGVLTPEDLRYPAVALIAAAAIAAFTPRGHLTRADLIAMGRLLALGLPLLAVFVAAYPSQPDTFTNQLPNAVYLYDYGQFPADNRPPMLAVWPAFPYNLQFAGFLPALLTPDFPPAILTHVNLLLQLAFALLLARGIRSAKAPLEAPPSWVAIATALLLTTFLNPAFNPKIQLSGYGDPAVSVAVAFAAFQAERLLNALVDRRSAAHEHLALTFVLLAGIAIKQVSVVLMGGVIGTAFLIGAFDRRIGPARAAAAFLPALLPGLLMLGVWRFYVSTHFAPDAELRLMPISEWNISALPAILANMALAIWKKLPFFVLLYGLSLTAIPLAFRRGRDPLGRLCLLILGSTVTYTGFLLFTYVAHFPGDIGASAHSFFRYNTHLALLAMLVAVYLLREAWLERGAPEFGRFWPLAETALIALACLTPIAGATWMRYDLRQPQPLVWDLARWVAPILNDGAHVALLLPGAGTNRSDAFMLRVAIAMTPPRHAEAVFHDISRADSDALDEAKKNGDRYVLISCMPPDLARRFETPSNSKLAGQAALLLNDQGIWRLLANQAYPADLPPLGDWTAELTPGPFCH